jgi:3-keto-5-aminohexanoate cleavage enzyme
MHNPRQMVDGVMRMTQVIKDIDADSFITVCAAGRASTYLATMAMLLGLHVRIGMEDTIWKWPHRDDILDSNAAHFKQISQIAELLGRELMTAAEYRAATGMPMKSRFKAEAVHA